MIFLPPIIIFVFIFLYAFFYKSWRWFVFALVLYMPFSGLPGILLYDYIGSGLPTLIKDFIFVIPAYIGFVALFE